MDSNQKAEVQELKSVLSDIQKGDKCIPCRIVFFFSLVVFLAVAGFVLYTRMHETERLLPVPPELAPQISPQEYENRLLQLEQIFHQGGSVSSSSSTDVLPTKPK